MNKTWDLYWRTLHSWEEICKSPKYCMWHVNGFKEGVVDYTLAVVRKAICDSENVFFQRRGI